MVDRGGWDELVEVGQITNDPDMVGGGAVIVLPGGLEALMNGSTIQHLAPNTIEHYCTF